MGQSGIVLELQRDCLDTNISASTILRKAKLIAAKLELDELKHWIESELEGYTCSLEDLPHHRKGVGQPKFHNPYNGWCPILTEDDYFGKIIRTLFLRQPVSELEDLLNNKAPTLIMHYNPGIEKMLQESLPAPMICALHFSTSQIVSALEYVRNKTLDWTLELESRGIVGKGLTFDPSQKTEAQMVTNHIYGGNIGVLGNVAGDANASKFISTSGIDAASLNEFLNQAFEALPALPSDIKDEASNIVAELKAEMASTQSENAIRNGLSSLKKVLEGAGGNLVAQALLSGLGVA
jgi:hypothetical protein